MLYRLTGVQQPNYAYRGIGYTFGEKAEHVAALVTAAPVRLAFDGLVRLNIFGLATRLAKLIAKNSDVVEHWWYKWGGDYSKLKSTVSAGAARNRILGINQWGIDQNNTTLSPDYRPLNAQVGSIAAGILTALIAAIPLLIAVKNLFNDNGEDSSGIQTGNFTDPADAPTGYGGTPTGYGSGGTPTGYGGTPGGANNSGGLPKTILGVDPMILLLGAGALYFLTKKN